MHLTHRRVKRGGVEDALFWKGLSEVKSTTVRAHIHRYALPCHIQAKDQHSAGRVEERRWGRGREVTRTLKGRMRSAVK